MKSLFGRGFRGLSDTLFSGVAGSVYRTVGIDSRSEPGVLKAHQKLTKHSGSTIDELCKVALSLSDGSKLWFSSISGKIWREVAGAYTLIHTLNLVKWDILTLGFTGESITTTGQNGTHPMGLFITSGGIDKFFIGTSGGSFINEYRDTTASNELVNFSYHSQYNHNTQTSSSTHYVMRPNGTKWYVSSATVIYQYTPGANITISSSTYDSISFTPAQTSSIFWFGFNADGTKLYIAGNQFTTPIIYQYSLSTAWNVSTATYDSISLDISGTVDFVRGMSMTPDGDSLIIAGTLVGGDGRQRLFQYRMSTAFAINTATLHRHMSTRGLFLSSQTRSLYIQATTARGIYPASNRMYIGTLIPGTPTKSGTISFSGNIVYQAQLSDTTPSSIVLGAGEIQNTYPDTYTETFVFPETIDDLPQCIVLATSQYVVKMKVSQLPTVANNLVPVGTFITGNDTHHPVIKQNTSLYIGDGNVVAQLDREGVFSPATNLNVPKGETIKALAPYDIDILIGTAVENYGRVLRWDGLADSWIAEDNVYEKEGVEAFIQDDNYVYVVAGRKGAIYYYNGARCEDFITLPEIDDLDTIKVNPNAVGFYLGSPIFGVSNASGNPILQGVYGYGSYNTNYSKSLSLDYPISTNQFSGVEIGAIIVDGDDMYVSWKDATSQGVDKVDWTAKYASAYFETTALTPAMNRHQAKTVSDVMVPYFALPASTGVTIGINKDYAVSFTNMDVVNDTVRKIIKLKSPSVPDTVNPRLRIGLTVSSNATPKIEDVLFNIAPVGQK